MDAKDGDAVGPEVNDEGRKCTRRWEVVSGVVRRRTQRVVSLNRRGGLCSEKEAPPASDKESVQFSLLSTCLSQKERISPRALTSRIDRTVSESK